MGPLLRFTASLTEEFKNRLKWRLKGSFRRETPKEASCKYSSCQKGTRRRKAKPFSLAGRSARHWTSSRVSGRERKRKTEENISVPEKAYLRSAQHPEEKCRRKREK